VALGVTMGIRASLITDAMARQFELLKAWALVKTDPFLPAKSRPPVKQDLSSLPRG